jgi:carboxymethylenebutenolidase
MKNTGIIVLVIFLALIALVLYGYAKNRQQPSMTGQDKTSEEKKNIDAMKESDNAVLSSGKEIQYFTNAGGKQYTGFLAEPDIPGDYPGVVMIHEWWGLNKEIKEAAIELSKQGYRVLAVDLYGRAAATTPDEARALTTSVAPAETTANTKAAAKYLRDTGSDKIASLGWCYGGGKSLELALSGEKLSATVIYYGTPLVTDKNALAKLKAPVLGIFGDKDTAIPVQTVKDFQGSLIMNDIKNDIKIYPGVGHAFANPSGANYAPTETADAWAKTLAFLKANL